MHQVGIPVGLPFNLNMKRLMFGHREFYACRVGCFGNRDDRTLLRTQTRKHTTHEVQYELNEYLVGWSLDGEDKDYLGFLLAVSLQVVEV